MGLTAKDGGNFKLVPPGAYIARCFRAIDLGTQTSTGQYGTRSVHKLRLEWEVFGEDESGQPLTITIDGEQRPMTIAKEYTVSLNEKASLRKDLAAWRGRDFNADELKGFSVAKLLNAYCMLNVTHSDGSSGKTYANVAGLSPLPKQLAASKPTAVHPAQLFDLDEPDMDVFASLPAWLQDRIREAPEWAGDGVKTPALAGGDIDDDIPF